MAKRPTEADLEIDITPEEVAAQTPQQPIDDVPIGGDDDPIIEEEISELTDREKADAAERARAPDGKFAKAEKVAPKAEVPPPGFVSQAALREAREENKTIMSRLTTLLEMQAAREAKANAPKVEAPVIPDKNVDPLAYIEYMDQRIGKFEKADELTTQQRQAVEREQNEMNRVLAVAAPQFQEATAADPTVAPTYKALLNSFGRELMFINQHNPDYSRDPRGFLQRELSKLENAHIKHAVATSQNVAIYMRALAASRGVTAAAEAAPVANGQHAAPAAQRSIEERVHQQQRHASLGDAPGGEAPKAIDAKTLAKMSNKEFADFAKKMSDSDLDALMGGRG